jgi:hypothetical protein
VPCSGAVSSASISRSVRNHYGDTASWHGRPVRSQRDRQSLLASSDGAPSLVTSGFQAC